MDNWWSWRCMQTFEQQTWQMGTRCPSTLSSALIFTAPRLLTLIRLSSKRKRRRENWKGWTKRRSVSRQTNCKEKRTRARQNSSVPLVEWHAWKNSVTSRFDFVSFQQLSCVLCSHSHVGWHFWKLFQSSKLKARTSLFNETWQKRCLSFELWALKLHSKMSPQVGLAVRWSGTWCLWMRCGHTQITSNLTCDLCNNQACGVWQGCFGGFGRGKTRGRLCQNNIWSEKHWKNREIIKLVHEKICLSQPCVSPRSGSGLVVSLFSRVHGWKNTRKWWLK